MPAIIKVLQINNEQKRKHIIEAIRAETDHLPGAYEISILSYAENHFWELALKPPGKAERYLILKAKDGDWEPEAFRKRMRELIPAS